MGTLPTNAFALCILLFCSMLPIPIGATIVEELSEKAMTRRAHLIVDATVVSQVSRRIGKSKRIVTDSVLRVRQFIKGRTASHFVTVRCMGGTVGSVTASVSGETILRKHRRALLFLTPAQPSPWDRSPTYYYIVNMAFGAYHIFTHPKTKQPHAIRQSQLPTQLKRQSSGHWHTHHPMMTKASLPLITLKQRIHAQFQSHKAQYTPRNKAK